MPVEPALLRIPDAAAMLAVSRQTIYRMMDAGLLKSIKIGKKCRRIKRKSIEDFLAQTPRSRQRRYRPDVLPEEAVASEA